MVQEKKKIPLWAKIIIPIMVIIAICGIAGDKKQDSNPPETPQQTMSDQEAQTKCMLMEEADLVNLAGETFSNEVVEKAQKFCLSLWDSPDKVESFKKATEMDWGERKTEILQGYTLEQIYNESNE